MKKMTFLILCVLFIYPQNTSSQFLTGFGIKAGLTFSNENFSYTISHPEEEHKLITGFNTSLYAEFLNQKYISLMAETGYDQRGYVWAAYPVNEFGIPIGEVDHGFRTHYIFVSFGPKLKYTGKNVTPYISILPRVSFYMGNKMIYPENVTLIGYGHLDDYKKVMFDIGIGGGVEFSKLLPFKVFIEGSYYHGIITSYSNSYLNIKESSFNIKLGINFIKDKKKK
jgi:hypothetical protein